MPKTQTSQKKKNQKPSIVIVKVGGYLDFTTSDEIDQVIEGLLSKSSYNIIIDLENVEYISSRGWSIFLSKIKEIRDNGGDLKLARLKPDIFQVFELLEFFWFLKTYDTLEEAITDFDEGVPPMPE
ncbi:MAG: STAS domain-containing protein [bacterium]